MSSDDRPAFRVSLRNRLVLGTTSAVLLFSALGAAPALGIGTSIGADAGTSTGTGTASSGQAVATAGSDEAKPVGEQSAQQQRVEPDPPQKPRPDPADREDTPADKYAMAGGCYALQDRASGRWIDKADGQYSAGAQTESEASGFHFQATDLGTYLLYDADEKFVARDSEVNPADKPSPDTEWPVTESGDGFAIGSADEALHISDDGSATTGEPTELALHITDGCADWPEADVNVSGSTFQGTTPIQEVRGYIDDHIHHMAFDFLGGGIHCGRPWHKYGAEFALEDCADHIATDGKLAIPEIILSGRTAHDPSGWPDFKGWPAHDSLTHEGTYYTWMERAWRSGQRVMVNLLVQNEVLCAIFPNLGDPPATLDKDCGDMATVTKQAKQAHEFQDYVDAQWGGPGKGWYRIVDTPDDARQIINDGKMAVILGTETSDIFNCSKLHAVNELLNPLGLTGLLDQANPTRCTESDIDAGLDKLDELGVRQMVMTHKFDNAFGGTKGDDGFNGVATNLGNAIQTGSFLGMQQCENDQGPDNAQLRLADIPQDQLAEVGQVFGPLAQAGLPVALPLYPDGEQCNRRGLTDLGEYMVTQMAERNMIVDVDHFSAKARSEALDVLEDLDYSGVISSHTWADDHALPRVYKLGGFIGRMAGDSQGYADQWKKMADIMDGRYFWGLGYASDINGLAAQGGPRGVDAENPVTYPFTGMGGVEIDRQQSGNRQFDINTDGVAHYGLYPDWIEDLRHLEGDEIVDDMQRGSEAYLQMWERARGVTNDACRQPELRKQTADFDDISTGMSAADVLQTVGQPHVRHDADFRYCALDGKTDAAVTVTFDGSAVQSVDRQEGGGHQDPADGDVDESSQTREDSPSPGADTSDHDNSGGNGNTSSGTEESAARQASGLPGAGGPAVTYVIAALLALSLGAGFVLHSRRFCRQSGR